MIFENQHPAFHKNDNGGKIVRGAARALFMSAFADAHDEAQSVQNAGDSSPWTDRKLAELGSMSGRDYADVLPARCDPNASAAALALVRDVLKANSAYADLSALYRGAISARIDGPGLKPMTPENFGHYLAFQALGHGIGLEELGDGVRDLIRVPYIDWGMGHLFHDYF